MRNSIKSLIAVVSLLAAGLSAHAIPACITNFQVTCISGAYAIVPVGGIPTYTTEFDGTQYISSADPYGGCQIGSGPTITFYIPNGSGCPTADTKVAIAVYTCSGAACGLGNCDAGQHTIIITVPAGCDSVTGQFCSQLGCCSLSWVPQPCHNCNQTCGTQTRDKRQRS